MSRNITPLPVHGADVLLFGGLFDPPHRAHVELALAARDAALGSEAWLVYVPAARSPHKPGGPVASDDDRLAMLRLAIQDAPRAAIWTDELDRGEMGYWVDTLERARSLPPWASSDRADPSTPSLRFLIGADQALAFHRWREYRRILELAEPVVLLRRPARTRAQLREQLVHTGAWNAEEIDAWVARAPIDAVMDASSEALRAGSDTSVVPAQVHDYIVRHSLYASPECD